MNDAAEAERLFAVLTVDDMVKFTQQTHRDINDTQAELRALIGQRYRELLGCCDLVAGMSSVARSVEQMWGSRLQTTDSAVDPQRSLDRREAADNRWQHAARILLRQNRLLEAIECYQRATDPSAVEMASALGRAVKSSLRRAASNLGEARELLYDAANALSLFHRIPVQQASELLVDAAFDVEKEEPRSLRDTVQQCARIHRNVIALCLFFPRTTADGDRKLYARASAGELDKLFLEVCCGRTAVVSAEGWSSPPAPSKPQCPELVERILTTASSFLETELMDQQPTVITAARELLKNDKIVDAEPESVALCSRWRDEWERIFQQCSQNALNGCIKKATTGLQAVCFADAALASAQPLPVMLGLHQALQKLSRGDRIRLDSSLSALLDAAVHKAHDFLTTAAAPRQKLRAAQFLRCFRTALAVALDVAPLDTALRQLTDPWVQSLAETASNAVLTGIQASRRTTLADTWTSTACSDASISHPSRPLPATTSTLLALENDIVRDDVCCAVPSQLRDRVHFDFLSSLSSKVEPLISTFDEASVLQSVFDVHFIALALRVGDVSLRRLVKQAEQQVDLVNWHAALKPMMQHCTSAAQGSSFFHGSAASGVDGGVPRLALASECERIALLPLVTPTLADPEPRPHPPIVPASLPSSTPNFALQGIKSVLPW